MCSFYYSNTQQHLLNVLLANNANKESPTVPVAKPYVHATPPPHHPVNFGISTTVPKGHSSTNCHPILPGPPTSLYCTPPSSGCGADQNHMRTHQNIQTAITPPGPSFCNTSSARPNPTPRNSRTMEEWKHDMEIAKAKRKEKGKARGRKRMWNKTVNQAEQINTNLRFEDLRISNEGWMGKRYDSDDNGRMKRMWRNRTIENEMTKFQRVPFNVK